MVFAGQYVQLPLVVGFAGLRVDVAQFESTILILPARARLLRRDPKGHAMRLYEMLETAAVAAALLITPDVTMVQASEPDGARVQRGALPSGWRPSGPTCAGTSTFEIHAYNDDLYVLRESGCTNYEKPFLFLLFGRDKALLLDTGAGHTDVARVVGGVIDRWLAKNHRKNLDLVVAHTHAHDDHTSGDAQLGALPKTTVVGTSSLAVQTFFGFKAWPTDIVTYDLGERVLDVVAIPGHEPSSIAVYDRATGILFTGDTLYPGRLYVRDATEFSRSVRRLVEFTRGKVVAHILGNHIEQSRTPYLDYPVGTVYQPDEHSLELGRAHLLELDASLTEMGSDIRRQALRDFTIWPK